jgi:uroporphyrinogen decarboxylase
MKEMTSRERVIAAVNHQEADRVPVDIGGGSNTSISIEGYERLKGLLGIQSPTRTMNMLFRVAELDRRVIDTLGGDCLPLRSRSPRRWTSPPSEPDTYIDMWGIKWKKVAYDPGCYYWDIIHHPLAGAETADLEDYPWPDPLDPGAVDGLADEAIALYEDTPYAIEASNGFSHFWERAVWLRGFEQILMDLVLKPEFVTRLMEKLLELNIAGTGLFLEKAGPYIQIFRTADDLATQNSLLMSPDTFRRLLKPTYQRYFDFVKSKTPAKILFHSCGRINDLIDDLAETGVDILNPVQVTAIGDTAELKACYGGKMVFWGGIDTQHVLPHGSAEEVEEEVIRRIRDMAPGGGYVLAAVHAIQPDVPPENIVAMAKAAKKYGRYPITV